MSKRNGNFRNNGTSMFNIVLIVLIAIINLITVYFNIQSFIK